MNRRIGRYKLLKELGKGGMGVVYLGENVETGDRVAVKLLPPELTRTSKYVERFRREALAVSQFEHPNIIKVLDVGEENGVHFFAMEYLEGPTLRDLLKQRGRLTISEAVRVTTAICDALDLAHSRGIIHRDVKPDNIMADADGTFKVMDFGIAHAEEGTRLTVTGTIMGTPEYMSPEQASGGPVDRRSDIYSMGIVLYEMLTGKAPFRAETALEVLQMHITKIPEPPKLLNPEIPGNVANVIGKMIEKQPANRYDSFRHVMNALNQAIPESMRASVGAPPRELRRPSAVPAAQPSGIRARKRVVVHVPATMKVALAASILLNFILFGCLALEMGKLPETAKPARAAFKIGGQMFAPPVVSANMLFLGAEDGTLYAYDLQEGATSWTFHANDKITAAPVADGNRVYVGSWDQHIYALDAGNGGNLIWKCNIGGCVFATPVLSDGTLYVCARDGRVFAIDAETGREKWKADAPAGGKLSPTVRNGSVFVPSGEKLLVFGLTDGKREAVISTDRMKTPLVAVDQEAYFISFNETADRDELRAIGIGSEASRANFGFSHPNRMALQAVPSGR